MRSVLHRFWGIRRRAPQLEQHLGRPWGRYRGHHAPVGGHHRWGQMGGQDATTTAGHIGCGHFGLLSRHFCSFR